MHISSFFSPSLVRPLLAAGLCLVSALAVAAVPRAFTATYRVSQHDQPLGEATVRLQSAEHGEWIYSKHMQGTAGLAALLGANLDESSRFRWKNDVPEAVSYDYQLDAAIKTKQRHLRVDWATNKVTVDEGKGPTSYDAVPGMVERNTTALAIGVALRDGQQTISLPVAVRQNVETQRFKVGPKESISVPAGSFNAVRVDRVDAERGFSAWYVPDRYPLPVKLSQHDGGDLTMELVSYKPD